MIGYAMTRLSMSFNKLIRGKQLRHYVMLRINGITEGELVYMFALEQGIDIDMDLDYSNASEFLIRQALEVAVQRHQEQERRRNDSSDERSRDSSSEDTNNDNNNNNNDNNNDSDDEMDLNDSDLDDETSSTDSNEEEHDQHEEEEEEEQVPEQPRVDNRFFMDIGAELQEIFLQQLLLESFNQLRQEQRQQEDAEDDGPIVEEIVVDSNEEDPSSDEPVVEEIAVSPDSINGVDWSVCW